MIDILIQSARIIFSLTNLSLIAFGVSVGVIVAAIPGLTGVMAIAIMLPLTFKLGPLSALCLLIGVYKGSQFGGSIPAILIKIPGAPEASATLLDGYPLREKGYPVKAIKMALYSSVIADISSDIYLIFLAAILAPYALKIGPPEKFALILFSLALIGVITAESPLKGIFSACVGMLLALIGIDPITGNLRFTFGQVNLIGGISLIPLMLGFFAIPTLGEGIKKKLNITKDDLSLSRRKDDHLTLQELKSCLGTIIRSGAIGAFIGAVPGLGSGPAAFISYSVAKSRSKKPEKFGQGSLHGIAAAEAGNSGTVGATLLPVLLLGIPGSGIAALFMAALLIQGITPGSQIFVEHPVIVYGLFIALIVGNIFNWLISELLIPLAKKIIQVKPSILYPIVFLLCIIGVYGVNHRIFDIFVMLFIGIASVFMGKFSIPVIPAVIGFVLGPIVEKSFRQSLLMFDYNYLLFFTRPVDVICFILAIFSIIYGIRFSFKKNTKK